MDTLHFEPRGFHPQGPLPFRDQQTRGSDELNLSEVEVFMLRGRRLQAQAVGGALRQGFARLRRLLRRPMAMPAPRGSRAAPARVSPIARRPGPG